MRFLVQILLLFITITVSNQSTCIASNSYAERAMHETQQEKKDIDQNNTKYHLHQEDLQAKNTPDAILTDASHTIRLCNSRPQRILPLFGSKLSQLVARNNFNDKFYILHFQGIDRYLEQVTTSIPSSSQNDYYVIALRHIIR